MTSLFLTAYWKYLAMVNYEVDPSLLEPYVPSGTELDTWNGKTLVSMVGFLFRNTRLKGIPVPFHRNFEEVNLRYYVRCQTNNEIRRGVVFIKEIVPKWMLALVAHAVYNENYVSMPMRHDINETGEGLTPKHVTYRWKFLKQWSELSVIPTGAPYLPKSGSEEEFITEHYWGYVTQRDGTTKEYRIEHPQWEVWQTSDTRVVCDVTNLYGDQFADALSRAPSSAFLAKGSDVIVRKGSRIHAAT